MQDPVMLLGDGHTYERSWIESWLAKHNTAPRTNEELEPGGRVLVGNRMLRAAIEAWQSRRQ